MRTAVLALLCASAAVAQTQTREGLAVGKVVAPDFKKMSEMLNHGPHIHSIPFDCKGQPDQVYAREGANLYFACLNGKDVCSDERSVTIPYKLIQRFEEAERTHDARMAETRAKVSKPVEEAKGQSDRIAPGPAGPASVRASLQPSMSVRIVSAAELAPGTAGPPVADAQLKSIPMGMTRAELIGKLGDPQIKVTGAAEYYTYMLASGNSVQMELTEGKVTSLQVVRMR